MATGNSKKASPIALINKLTNGNYIKGIKGRVAVLKVIKKNPECSVYDIANSTGMKYATVVKILERMVAFNEVEAIEQRHPCKDKRGHIQSRKVNVYKALVEEILGGEELIEQYTVFRKSQEEKRIAAANKRVQVAIVLPKLKENTEYYTLCGVQFPYSIKENI